MSDEDDFEEGLKEILSNKPSRNSSSGGVRKEPPPRLSEPLVSKPQAYPSGNKFIETRIRIAAALIALGLLTMFGLQLYQR